MEKLFEIAVKIENKFFVQGHRKGICMLLFTGTAAGKYFNGKVLGTGTDTQTVCPECHPFLSARYMLEGTDSEGKSCRIFIENRGTFEDGFFPAVVTDSRALAPLEEQTLSAQVTSTGESSVKVAIYGSL